MSESIKIQKRHWWEREDLLFKDSHLHFAKKDLSKIVSTLDTPCYLYSVERVVNNLDRLVDAFKSQSIDYKIHYAIKANRHPDVLKAILNTGKAGADVCSPDELDFVSEIGFEENQINYTGHSISSNDYRRIAKYKAIQFNADSLSVIRQIGDRKLFGQIGIRINPEIGMGYNESLEYSGNIISKFGIYSDQIEEAFKLASNYNIEIDTIHCHVGSGYLTPQLENFKLLLYRLSGLCEAFNITKVNLGGGLGVPQAEGDQVLDLKEWARLIKEYLPGKTIIIEPGDYLVKDAGVLVAEVTYIEQKKDINFFGLNAGMNINYEYAYYNMNLEAVPLILPATLEQTYTLAGNINEPIDLMGEQVKLPRMKEGDLIALLNTGGYGASTSSNHCMRGVFKEIILDEL